MTATVYAQPDKSELRKQSSADGEQAPPHPALYPLDVNNSPVWIRRNGQFDWEDPFSGDNDAYPRGALSHVTFAQGIVYGGKVRDESGGDSIRVNGSTYASGMAPGGIKFSGGPNGTVAGPDRQVDFGGQNRSLFHIWRVDRNWAATDENGNYTVARQAAAYTQGVSDPSAVSQSAVDQAVEQFEYDWNNWGKIVERYNAPYEECNGTPGYQSSTAVAEAVATGSTCRDDNGNPNLNGDIPGRPGADQTVWLVTNDIGPSGNVSQNSYGSPPMGMEIQTTIWGYDRPPGDPLGNINFIETKLVYTGLPGSSNNAQPPRIDSMFTTWWVDPDVGTFSNDFAGVDTSLSMGYAYNAQATDSDFQQEGLPPAAGGWDFLKGPVNAQGDTLGLTSFVYFAAGSDISDPDLGSYAGTLQWYNLMRGKRPRPEYPQGDPFVNPITGNESVFTLPGDPVTGSGWIDGATLPPGDRRIVNTSGPFQMTKGDTVSVVVGKVNAVGSSNLSSVSRLKFFDTAAQFAFDQNFDIPSPPASPSVTATALDEKAVINWGTNTDLVNRIESYSQSPGFKFQGYRVYQLPSRTASLEDAERVASFDVADNVRTLVDNVFEEESGFVVQKPVESLDNEGIKRTAVVTRDQFRDRPLSNGSDYHYAVTSYGYLNQDKSVPSRILESSPTRITVRPQPPQPGTPDSSVYDVGQQVAGISKSAGPGDVNVSAQIVDPGQVVNASYTITFDVSGGNCTFSVLQDGNSVLTGESFGVDPSRQSVGGVKSQVFDGYCQGETGVFGLPQARETSIFKQDLAAESNTGLDLWGDATLFGAPVGWYSIFNPALASFPPSVENAQQDLEFRFTGNGGMESPTTDGGQLATYYPNAAFANGQPDTLAGATTIRMPFELWETEKDRQINFAVINRNADGGDPWNSLASAAPGDLYYRMSGRDYIVPIHTEYDASTLSVGGSNKTNPASADASWLLFFRQSGASTWSTGDTYKTSFANPLDPGNTEYSFSTEKIETGNEQDLNESVADIGVFPNPYRGFNRLENSRFDKFVRFHNLPDPAQVGQTTIRIFTLAGNPVRVLKHTEDSPNANFHDWDLRNQGDVPVASGIYLAHVSTPNGDKTLKIAIVQEEEILRRY